MQARPFRRADYDRVCEWWKARGQPVPVIEILPPLGVIVEDLVACWFYLAEACPVAFCHLLVSNPLSSAPATREAGALAIGYLCEEARQRGYFYVVSHVTDERLAAEAVRLGFTRQETPKIELTMNLGG